MSPLGIEILLHYYTRPSDYREGDFSAPAVRELIDTFKSESCDLLRGGKDDSQCYSLSERGEAYVRALMDMPLPVLKWIMPTVNPTQKGTQDDRD